MDYTSQEMDLDSFSTGVFELPGEPAVVVNGLPPLPPNDGNLVPCPAITDAELHRDEGFGQWLEGREVQKLFGGQFYIGKVTKYDVEMHWYKVVYEDGDSEELDWQELKEILLPLDIDVPLKTLATKITKSTQKHAQETGKTDIAYREMGLLESGQIKYS
nr:dirigent protein 17-like [Ipomoea batatas]